MKKRPYPLPGTGLAFTCEFSPEVARWLSTNVIDLWKEAFVATAGLQTLLVVAALDQGLRRPFS